MSSVNQAYGYNSKGWVKNIISSSWKSRVLPVNDPVAVQEHQRRRHFGGVEAGSSLVKLPGALDLKHQVAAVHVLHDEEEAVLAAENKEEWANYANLKQIKLSLRTEKRIVKYLLET